MQEIYGQGMNRFWTSLAIIFALGITWAWAQSSRVLHEDFTCSSGKWVSTRHTSCKDDQINIQFDEEDAYYYRFFPGIDLADAIIEADAIKLSGKDTTSIGLICRLKNNSFYTFLYYPETFEVGIYKHDRDEWDLLAWRTLSKSVKLNPSDTANRFRAECLGEKLTLSINRQPVLTAYDNEFLSGGIGMIAAGNGSQREPVEVAFDNLEISNAGQP
jgi:hypothetical protein